MGNSSFRSFGAAYADDLAALSLMNFAMKYQSSYEGFYDSSLSFPKGGRKVIQKIVSAAKKIYDDNTDAAEMSAELSELRDSLIDRMEVLTGYADFFGIHEYILNRIELKFTEENLPETDNDEEARSILSYIFEPEDNMEVNLRIKEMISQLPVRMTANRFFDLVNESFTVYKGSERESLNSHVYMIRMAAGLLLEGEDTLFPELKACAEKFEAPAYKDFTKEDYDEYSEALSAAAAVLTENTEFVMAAMEMLNELTVYYLVLPYVTARPAVAETVHKSIMMVSSLFEAEDKERNGFAAPDIELTNECFSALEGRPEKLSAKISGAEGRLESFKGSIDGEDSLFMDALVCAGKLMGSSEFVKLDHAYDITVVDSEMIDETAARVTADLKALFDKADRTYRRAVMAHVLKELPVFFVSRTEVMNYIRYTLDNCKDSAEKEASLRLFRQTTKQ